MGARQVTVPCKSCGGAGYSSCGSCAGSGSRTVTLNDQRRCPQCGGSDVNCSTCCGSGYVIESVTRQEMCAQCNGAGRFQCSNCSGNGTVSEWVYEPDPPAVELSKPLVQIPTDTLPHLSAATSEQIRPDPVQTGLADAMKQQLDDRGYLDPPIRIEEFEEYLIDSTENGMEPLDWREWDLQQRIREGGHGPHPIEEAGESLVE